MKRILHPTKDCYITNKIIGNTFRATDANVGLAGTLDLFKLAGETQFTREGPFISGTTDPIELSRILIKFDLTPLMSLTSSILDLSHSSFKCSIKMKDVFGGQTVPSNYTLILYPLSQSFDEGIGRDVNAFDDIDVANFLTASVSSGLSTWFASGAAAAGYNGQESVDFITGSTSLGNLFVTQVFTDGSEDLEMDITTIVSATITQQIPNHGFRISFSGSQETDDRTRFVKRFATRHSTDPMLRPVIEVGFDDSIQDHHKNFYFDVSGTLFINNFRRSLSSNIVSGVALTPITGTNSLIVTLLSGNYVSGAYFRKIITASQHLVGQNNIVGLYSASFAISLWESSSLLDHVRTANSATFTEIWGSLDGTVGYYTGSLVVYDFQRSAFSNSSDQLYVTAANIKNIFKSTEKQRIRIFAQDGNENIKAVKVPYKTESLILENAHYRVVDLHSEKAIFDFDYVTNSTKLSTDSEGMYFDIYMSDLIIGRVYGIDIRVERQGAIHIFNNVGGTFRVDS